MRSRRRRRRTRRSRASSTSSSSSNSRRRRSRSSTRTIDNSYQGTAMTSRRPGVRQAGAAAEAVAAAVAGRDQALGRDWLDA